MNFAITKSHFSLDDMKKIDPRFLPYLSEWRVEEVYKGNKVVIPDITVFNYYEVTDKPGETENEKEVSLACGWRGTPPSGLYDREVLINLRIEGKDVLNTSSTKMKVEIIKSGGAPMKVYYKNRFVTDFTQKYLWVTLPNGYKAFDSSQL